MFAIGARCARILLAVVLLAPFAAGGDSARSRGSAASEVPDRGRELHVRGRDRAGLPTVRFSAPAVRAAGASANRVRLRRFPLRRDLEVELDVVPFRVTRGDTRFVLGRKDAPDEALDFDPSEVTLLRGEVVGRPGSRVVLALRDGRHTGQIDLGPGQPRYWISSRGADGELLEAGEASVFEAIAAPALPPDVPLCGVEGEARKTLGSATAPQPLGLEAEPEPRVGLLDLELAVETDYEFFTLFGDATDTAAYLVALYGQVSDIYVRDADTRVELVFARIWDQPDDLFNDVDPSPLTDFRNYWNSNMGGVSRDVAQLLSGRRDYPFGGQAYLSSLCGLNAYGVVGYAQGAFPDPTIPSPYNYDISVTAHELGHNAGTGHTHDSPNFVDTCDDPFTTPQRGTIMAYCGQTWSGGNSNRDLYFHSRIQQNLDSHIGGASCVVDDCNANGVADATDVSGAASLDLNGNVVPDECEDCNENSVLDPADISGGAPDLNTNGIPDECEPDCNTNSVPDDRDILLGTSLDAYGNDIPDECETDCDASGTSDYTEIQLDMTLDIDRNAALDVCQDCDADATPDLVELAGAHGLWLASGETATPVRRFHATTGVLDATSSGGAGALIAGGQDLIIVGGSRVLVSSADDDRVAEFDIAGVYQGDLVAAGSGGLDHPAGLALAPNGSLLVASHLTHEVLAYDSTTGAFQSPFVTAGLGGLTGPFALSFGPNGNLYVTREDGGVMEYDGSSGALVGTFVDPLDNGGLTTPRGLLFKPDGQLLVTSYGTDQTLEYQRDTGFPLGQWALSGTSTRLNQESPWGLRIGPNGNVFIVRTGEAFGSSAPEGGGNDHAELHLTNAQIYEFDVRTGNFIRAHINGNDHGMEFPTGFDFLPGYTIDCNRNQVQDACDISASTSQDVDFSGIPDECELDCNTNAIQDRLDLIPLGASTDCNANLVPDECDTAAGTPGACEPNAETDCVDGFDNDRDGQADCADAECDVTAACLGGIELATGFDVDAGLFGYVDDAFRGTNAPAYASGVHQGTGGFEGSGGLFVEVGGIDGADILGMSGGWRRSFTLAEADAVTLSLRYRMLHAEGYEADEFSQVMLTVDGANVGTSGNDYIVQLTGDGQGGSGGDKTTFWQTVSLDLGTLAAGGHTFTIGLYNNKKTFDDEWTRLWLDDVAIVTVEPAVCGDGLVSPGEDCDDGGTANGDCCSSVCAFEIAASPCDDVDACTAGEACDGAGGCSGTPVVCSDGDACTTDSCDAITGCGFDPIPGCATEIPATPPWGAFLIALMLAAAAALSIRTRASAG